MTSDHGSIFVGVFGILLILTMVLVAVAAFVFWIWMLIDALRNKGLSDTEKLVWVLVIVFLHFLGALIYFFVARSKRSALT
jgi:uncharacterized RDD family membrane protein YckC